MSGWVSIILFLAENLADSYADQLMHNILREQPKFRHWLEHFNHQLLFCKAAKRNNQTLENVGNFSQLVRK